MDIQELIHKGICLTESTPIQPLPAVAEQTKKDLMTLDAKTSKLLHIVFMGAVKAGKSTLLNALLGKTVSPVGISEMTASILHIYYGEKNKAVINKKGDKSITGSIDEIADLLKKRRRDMAFFKNCQSVEIELDCDLLKYTDFIDTPGLNTATKYNHELSMNYIQQADIIIWMLNANYLGESDVQEDLEKIKYMGKKIICVVSHMDDIPKQKHDKIMQFIKDTYQIYFEKIFSVSGREAMQAALQHDQDMIELSGLSTLQAYLKKHFMKDTEKIQTEALLDALKASVMKDIEYHESILENRKIAINAYRDLSTELDEQSEVIQRDFRYDFQRWVDYELLQDSSDALIRKLDNTSFSVFSAPKKEIKKDWQRTFSKKRIEEEVQKYVRRQDYSLMKMWEESLSKMAKRYGRSLSDGSTSLGTTNIKHELSSEESNALDTVWKSTAISAVLGTGASAYAAGLGTYAAHLSMVGAMGSFMLPALAVGITIGAIKSYYDYENEKDKIKDQIYVTVTEIRRSVYSAVQKNYEQSLKHSCDDICTIIKQSILQNSMQKKSIEEAINEKEKLESYVKKLRVYLDETPSYENVTNELRHEIMMIKERLEKKMQTAYQQIEKVTVNGLSEEEVNIRINQVRKELEEEKNHQIKILSKSHQEQQQLLIESTKNQQIQLENFEKKIRAMNQRLREKDQKLQENKQNLHAKDSLLNKQKHELNRLKKDKAELEEYIQDLEKHNSNKCICNNSIHDELMHMMRNAQTEIDIMSPWVSHKIVNDEFIDLVRHMIERKVVLKIIYGIENSKYSPSHYDREKRDNRLQESNDVIDRLKRLDKSGKYIQAKYFSSHSKLILQDEKAYLITSCNPLSNAGTNWEEIGEISINVENLKMYRKKYFDF